MNRRARKFPPWLLALVITAVAIAFLALDPFALPDRFAQLEFEGFRKLAPPGAAVSSTNSDAAQILLLEGIGALLAILFARRRAFQALAIAILAVAAAQAASWFLYAREGVFLDFATASAALLVAAAAGLAGSLLQRKFPRRGVPSLQRSDVGASPARRPAEPRFVASLSCGLRRAPQIAAAFGGNAAGYMRFAEEALTPLIDEAVQRGATIGHYDGTSFSAHWESAMHGPACADEACDAAEWMLTELAKFNDSLTRARGESAAELVEIGIGLSAGPALVGGVRARGRISTCVAGPGTELAERLRRLSARYGPAVLASGHIRDAAQRPHALLEVDFIAFERGEEPVKLYALLGNPLVAASPKFRAVATFHGHIFRALRSRDWEKARALVAQCRKLSGVSDKIYDLLLARIAWLEVNPPPAEWDGAFRPVVR